jgi:rhamnosyltransferase
MSGTAPEVSIVMRSFNEAWALRETLAMLRRQVGPSWELIVIDSGSTDGSVEMIRAFAPAHFVQIESRDYVPGRVMNHGMRLARANRVVFLNADATPANEHWLEPLAVALENPKVAAVFGRQIPRPDCRAVFACDYDRCFGENRESAKWDHFFSMVSSGLRKDIWSLRGFLENLQYAEDDEYTRWARSQGYEVKYCPDSMAIHSHNYTAQQAYKRAFGDAKALAACWPGSRSDFNWLKTVALGWANDFRHDVNFCFRRGRFGELAHAAAIRWSQRRGRLDGFRDGWTTYRTNAVDASAMATAKPRTA